MKILCVGNNHKGTGYIAESDFLDRLAERHDVSYYGKGYKQDIDLCSFMKACWDTDVILGLNSMKDHYRDLVLNSTHPRKYIIMTDIHRPEVISQLDKAADDPTIKVLLFRYMDTKVLPLGSVSKGRLFSYSAGAGYAYREKDEEKQLDIVLLGARGRVTYPLRHHMCKELPGFCRINNLSYFIGKKTAAVKYDLNFLNQYDAVQKKKMKAGPEFLETLSRARIMLTCSSIYRYPVRKYIEAMSAGALILADKPLHTKEIGLVDGETYVEINKTNWKQKALEYIHNKEERMRIVRNARAVFLQRHTHEKRIEELEEIIHATF